MTNPLEQVIQGLGVMLQGKIKTPIVFGGWITGK